MYVSYMCIHRRTSHFKKKKFFFFFFFKKRNTIYVYINYCDSILTAHLDTQCIRIFQQTNVKCRSMFRDRCSIIIVFINCQYLLVHSLFVCIMYNCACISVPFSLSLSTYDVTFRTLIGNTLFVSRIKKIRDFFFMNNLDDNSRQSMWRARAPHSELSARISALGMECTARAGVSALPVDRCAGSVMRTRMDERVVNAALEH